MRTPRQAVAIARDRLWTRRLVRQTERAFMPPPPAAFKRCPNTVAIVHPVRISSPEFIELGDRVLIHEHVWLDVRQRPGHPEPRLVLGDTVMLNRFVKIVCFGSVTLGRRVIIADRGYISDVEYEPGHANIDPALRPWTEPKPVVVEDGVFLGVGTVVKPGVTIGAHSYVGAGSVVTSDIPPRCVAVGSPARVIRQHNPDTDTWEAV